MTLFDPAAGVDLCPLFPLDRHKNATAPDRPRSPADRILEALGGATEPLTRRELRDACRLRNATLVDTLAALQTDGRVRVDAGRVQLVLV